MDQIEGFIREQVDAHPSDIVELASKNFGAPPAAIVETLERLCTVGILTWRGAGPGKHWYWPAAFDGPIGTSAPGLDEDRVWRESVSPQLSAAPDNVQRLFAHRTTEMVNNVIDHSEAGWMRVFVKELMHDYEVQVEDNGVGIFRKLMTARPELASPREVALELAKGKLTTAPAVHTGQGVFFTSRMCDTFLIWSESTACGHREGGAWHVETRTALPSGTVIRMAIRKDSTRTPKAVFDDFALPDLDGFVRTSFQAALISDGARELVSRSQAKRLLARCERFREVDIDFAGIDAISPAFADEAFRVFAARNPQTTVRPRNTNEQVRLMIERVLRKPPSSTPE